MAEGIKIKGDNGEPCQVESAIRDSYGKIINVDKYITKQSWSGGYSLTSLHFIEDATYTKEYIVNFLLGAHIQSNLIDGNDSGGGLLIPISFNTSAAVNNIYIKFKNFNTNTIYDFIVVDSRTVKVHIEE